jgi:hypothetical protein
MDSLHDAVFEKFRRALGEPHKVVGSDYHWALRPLAYIAAINVLLNGGSAGRGDPVVWVFDPHDPRDGVTNERIRHESEAEEMLEQILERVKTAGRRRI